MIVFQDDRHWFKYLSTAFSISLKTNFPFYESSLNHLFLTYWLQNPDIEDVHKRMIRTPLMNSGSDRNDDTICEYHNVVFKLTQLSHLCKDDCDIEYLLETYPYLMIPLISQFSFNIYEYIISKSISSHLKFKFHITRYNPNDQLNLMKHDSDQFNAILNPTLEIVNYVYDEGRGRDLIMKYLKERGMRQFDISFLYRLCREDPKLIGSSNDIINDELVINTYLHEYKDENEKYLYKIPRFYTSTLRQLMTYQLRDDEIITICNRSLQNELPAFFIHYIIKNYNEGVQYEMVRSYSSNISNLVNSVSKKMLKMFCKINPGRILNSLLNYIHIHDERYLKKIDPWLRYLFQNHLIQMLDTYDITQLKSISTQYHLEVELERSLLAYSLTHSIPLRET